MNYEMTGDIPSLQDTKELKSTLEMLEPGIILEHFRYEIKQGAEKNDFEFQPENTNSFSEQVKTRPEMASDYIDSKVRDWLNVGEGIWKNQTDELLSSLGMDAQLGLPYFEKKNGELCLSFKPHNEIYSDSGIAVYPQKYELECLYPSEKIVRFEMLRQDSAAADFKTDYIAENKPVCIMKQDMLASEGRFILEDLREAFQHLQDICREDGRIPDVSVKKYQKLYWKTVEELGLSDLYGIPEN